VGEVQQELIGLWAEWEVVQQKIMDVGEDVLGNDQQQSGERARLGSYREKAEIWRLDNEAKIDEVHHQVTDAGNEAVQRLADHEKASFPLPLEMKSILTWHRIGPRRRRRESATPLLPCTPMMTKGGVTGSGQLPLLPRSNYQYLATFCFFASYTTLLASRKLR
jgi:hypothetical protein